MSVDDNSSNQLLLSKALKTDYSVILAESGSTALKLLEEHDFGLILLDVNMPGMDGYKVCETIRKGDTKPNIPIIFISALNTLEDRLRGYQAGGNDYICKPVVLDELKIKIGLSLSQADKYYQLSQQLDFASQTAMTAMTNSGELGVLVSYMEETYRSQTAEELIKALTDSIAQYGLSSCIQIRLNQQVLNHSSNSASVSELENQLLCKGRDAKRIVILGKRALYNSHYLSILIRNMPVEDEDKNGRLKDHLAALITASESRIKHIEESIEQKSSRVSVLTETFALTEMEISNLQKTFGAFQDEVKRVMADLHMNIEESLLTLALTEEQEEHFLSLVDNSQKELDNVSDWAVGFEESLTQIKYSINLALEKEKE